MSEEVETFIQGLKVADLRDELKKRGLVTTGLKAVLVQRLQEAMMSELGDPSDNNEPAEENKEDSEIINVDDEEEDASEDGHEAVELTLSASEEEEDTTDADIELPPPTASEEELLDVEEPQVSEGLNEEPTATDEEKPSTIEEEKPSTTDEEKPSTTDEEKPSTTGEEKPSTTDEAPLEELVLNEESDDRPVPGTSDNVEELKPLVESVSVSEPSVSVSESSVGTKQDTTSEDEPMDFTVVDTAEVSQDEQSQDEQSQDEQSQDEQSDANVEKEKDKEDNKTETHQIEDSHKDDKMDGEQSEESRGMKRIREEDEETEREKEGREDNSKPCDPRDVSDPESVQDNDDNSIQAICNNLFVLPEGNATVTLNPYKSDLHFIISSDGAGGAPLTEGGFAYMRASAKGTWGVKTGCYYFECKIEEKLPVTIEEEETEESHIMRVGWSSLDSDMTAGDDRFSYCYESSGKKVTRSNTEDYGEIYTEGDVIGCYVNLTNEPKNIFFTKNGANLTEAFNLSEQGTESTLFPHVSAKNFRVSFNFGSLPSHFPVEEGYLPLQEASEEDKECVPTEPVPKEDCEVILMVGLPGCGKTYWSSRHMARNADKSYRILGPYQVFDQIMSKKKKSITDWKDFVELTSPMMRTLYLLASKLPCNYIIDQVNVYKDTQRQKMELFEGFARKSMVVIPPHHELRKRRVDRIRDGGCMELPQDIMDAFKANFHIPKPEDELFDEINFSEIYGPASDKIVRQYKDDALGLPTPYIPSKRPRYEPRGRTYSSPRPPKGNPYGYAPYGGSSSRYYPPASRGYYPPPHPHYRSGYYAPPPPPPGGGWGHHSQRGRYGHPSPQPNPRYGGPRPYYPRSGGGGGGGSYYNRY